MWVVFEILGASDRYSVGQVAEAMGRPMRVWREGKKIIGRMDLTDKEIKKLKKLKITNIKQKIRRGGLSWKKLLKIVGPKKAK